MSDSSAHLPQPSRSKSQEAQAAEHYSRMLGMEQHAREKGELRDADVSEHRIAALYGGTFDAVARYMLDQEAHRTANPNLQFGGWEDHSYEAIAVLQAMPETQRAKAQDAYDQEMTSEIFSQLCHYLNGKDRTNKWRRNLEGEDGAITLWHACWFQQHRSELTAKNQRRADSLMVWVGRNMLPPEPSSR